MNFLSLVTDFGLKDGAVARIKSILWKEAPNLHIVDVSHEINPFDIYEAAFVLNGVIENFPEGSVHLICVDALHHPKEKPICIELNQQYFIANNNGVLSLLQPDLIPSKIYEITTPNEEDEPVVEGVFCKLALHLLKGGELSVVGNKINALKKYNSLQPTIKENEITGYIVYVDNYGNAISNISKKLFEEVGKSRKFEIYARNYQFNQLQQHYSDVVKNFENETEYHGWQMALFNSQNYLEFAMYKSNGDSVGGAAQLLGLQKGQKIIINFL